MMTNLGNRITQGQFSFLPDLTDEQISKQLQWALKNGWAVSVEYTDDPHPRNTYWEMYGAPMFDLKDPAGIMMEINECRKTFPRHYIRVMAFDSSHGWETPRMSFIVNRPDNEPGFLVVRQERDGRAFPDRDHPQAISRRVAKILLMSVPAGSLKKASVSDCWFCASASSGSGRTTLEWQLAGIEPFTDMSVSS